MTAEDPSATDRWNALLALGRASQERPLGDVLLAVAETVHAVLGYGNVVINVYRPAWHDYEVVLVLGDEAARTALLGTTNTYESFHDELLRPELERVPGGHFLPAGDIVWEEMLTTFTPAHAGAPEDPDRWRPEDGVMVQMRTPQGEPLAILSVDDPLSGLRPTDAELEMLVAVGAHAELALENAARARSQERHRRALTAIAAFPTSISTGATADDLLHQACVVATTSFGFNAAAALIQRQGRLTRAASVGFPDPPGRTCDEVDLDLIQSAFEKDEDADAAHSGCRLVQRSDFLPTDRADDVHLRQGVGPQAWQDHWLMVPLREPDRSLSGVLVLEDPVDLLRPVPEQTLELRLLADQVTAALRVVRHRVELAHQANHDWLTGLRNRRDLESIVDELAHQEPGVSVLLCDLDQFKRINDQFGHATGDRVLEAFSDLLRTQTRPTDVAVRYGGEEFCLVLTGAGDEAARLIARRLLESTPDHLAAVVAGQTVSIGLATSRAGLTSGAALITAADEALYAAKQAGRNCVFAATEDGLEPGISSPTAAHPAR